MSQQYIAFVKGHGDNDLWQYGVYPNIIEAQKAVSNYVGSLGFRCPFKWENNLYRCGDKAENIHGKVQPVEPAIAASTTSDKYANFPTEQLEFMWHAVSNANPGTNVPHEVYLLWLKTVGELADAVRHRRGNK